MVMAGRLGLTGDALTKLYPRAFGAGQVDVAQTILPEFGNEPGPLWRDRRV